MNIILAYRVKLEWIIISPEISMMGGGQLYFALRVETSPPPLANLTEHPCTLLYSIGTIIINTLLSLEHARHVHILVCRQVVQFGYLPQEVSTCTSHICNTISNS